jgi:hypothetical protein
MPFWRIIFLNTLAIRYILGLVSIRFGLELCEKNRGLKIVLEY